MDFTPSGTTGRSDFDRNLPKPDQRLWSAERQQADVGLDPTIGWYHTMRSDRPTLLLDPLEPLRPSADAIVLKFVQSNTFTAADFAIGANGVCRLHPPLARALVAELSASIAVRGIVAELLSRLGMCRSGHTSEPARRGKHSEIFYSKGSANRDPGLPSALQHRVASFSAEASTARTGDRAAAACASLRAGRAVGHPNRGAAAQPELTSDPDHSMGAGQPRYLGFGRQMIANPSCTTADSPLGQTLAALQ